MTIEYFGELERPIAIVIRATAKVEGIKFFSPSDYPQQIGLMTRPAGYVVPTHKHNLVDRHIKLTQEVLLIRKGSCEVKLFDNSLLEVGKVLLQTGDVIFLAEGAHRIEMQSECELLEVKQGPYAGELDKTILENIEA